MIWNFYISHIKLLHFHHKCPFFNAHKNNNNKRTFILWRCRIHWMYERGLARAPNSQLSNDFILSWLCTFVSSPSRTFFRRKMNDFGTEKSTREDVNKVHNHCNNWIFYNFQILSIQNKIWERTTARANIWCAPMCSVEWEDYFWYIDHVCIYETLWCTSSWN